MSKAKEAFVAEVKPYYDRHRHTILKIGAEDKVVKFIPLSVDEGLKVVRMSQAQFSETYKEIPNYPVEKAVQLFLGYAKTLGATKEVMDIFRTVMQISEEVIQLAMAKRQVEESKVAPPKIKKEVKEKEVKEKKSSVIAPQKSAAQMFKDLIMEGKLTDDQIFAEVQENFGVDDSKRGYVKWYRNHLKKAGMNPPEAVEAVKPSKTNAREHKVIETGPKKKGK